VPASPTKFVTTASVNTLEGDRRCLAAPNAQGRNAARPTLALEGVEQRHDKPRPRRPYRMTKGTGTAIDVQAVTGDAEVALRGHGHDRKGLVDLE
jgi:hypothetical protein